MDYSKHICKAKRKNNNEWIEGYLVGHNEHYYIYYEYADEMCQTGNYLSSKEVIPETIGLCSSTRDRNGRLIFDKDIVRAYKHNKVPMIAKISYRNGCFYFGNYNWVEFLNVFRNIQVIGNVFDEEREM